MAEERETLENLIALGNLGLELGYLEQANGYFDRALALDPDNSQALLGKARALKDEEMALKLVRQVLAKDPQSAEARALEQKLLEQRASRNPLASDNALLSSHIWADREGQGPQVRPLARRREASLTAGSFLAQHWPDMIVVVLGLALFYALALGLWWAVTPKPQEVASIEAMPTQAVSTLPSFSASAPEMTPTVSASALQRAQAACVFILMPQAASPTLAKRGSGSVITQDGLILTNHHVIADDHQNLLNPQGLAFVGFTEDVREAPSIWYIAVFMVGDPVRDLAILRIVATEEGVPVQGSIFPTMTFGNSDQLVLGQTIIGLGYPTVGGNTLTLTKGTMAGYETWQNVRLGKTDSEIAPGSSGGAAIDEQGHLVGIIRMVRTEERTQGRLSYFVLLSEAKPLIDKARFASQPRVDLSWILRYRPRLSP